MALKFLNKKGWHTGSLRNIENVWKAEQKHEAEQKKLEELRLQIQQERERSEFRALQEQAGLVPRQERLEFLYDSGLAVGRGSGSSSGTGVSFQALEQPAKAEASSSGNNKQQESVPGALFEDKSYSANDAWRKLHSDPLLLIRQREQEALSRIKNNPVQMALIRKSVQDKKPKEKDGDKKEHKKMHLHRSSKHRKDSLSRHHSDSEEDSGGDDNGRKSRHHKTSRSYKRHYERTRSDSEDESKKRESHRVTRHKEKRRDHSPSRRPEREDARSYGEESRKRNIEELHHEKNPSKGLRSSDTDRRDKENGNSHGNSGPMRDDEPRHRRRNVAPKLSEEERVARLRQMQMDAELHEEQRWKRLKKAEEVEAQEAKQNGAAVGRNFLDAAHKRVYGAEKGGSSTIEESVRRRTHYSQRGSEAEGNAFRR